MNGLKFPAASRRAQNRTVALMRNLSGIGGPLCTSASMDGTDLALRTQDARLVRGSRDATSDAAGDHGRCWFDGCDMPQEGATET